MQVAVDPDVRQRHTAQGRPHHFRGRLRRLPTGLPRRDASQRRALFLQIAPYNTLDQYQDSQRNTSQTKKPHDALFVLSKQWGE